MVGTSTPQVTYCVTYCDLYIFLSNVCFLWWVLVLHSLSGDLVIGQVAGGSEFEWVISPMFVEAVFQSGADKSTAQDKLKISPGKHHFQGWHPAGEVKTKNVHIVNFSKGI